MRKYADHSVQACGNTEGKAEVLHTLGDLENVCRELQQHMPSHSKDKAFHQSFVNQSIRAEEQAIGQCLQRLVAILYLSDIKSISRD